MIRYLQQIVDAEPLVLEHAPPLLLEINQPAVFAENGIAAADQVDLAAYLF